MATHGLGLTPNEIVGFKIKPDWTSWNVVLVKRHGPSSKNEGKEYDTPVAYCKDLRFAGQYALDQALKAKGKELQANSLEQDGTVADVMALLAAVEEARKEVEDAFGRLQDELQKAGILNKHIMYKSGANPEPGING